MEGNVKPVSSIISEIANKWDHLTDAERQNTAVKVAGVYQLSRFNALMLNYKMAQDATATSTNSFNSAMREQEEYGKSLQARINRLDTAWTDFANTAGDKVLYDGIVVVTEALKGATDASNGIASNIGVLAPVFGILGMAAYGLSNNLRILVASTYAQSAASISASGTTGIFAGALTGLRTVASLTTVALRGLLIASGIGIAFAGVGFIIEKLTNVMSENIQKQEELDNYNKKNIEAITLNKNSVESLISTYKELSDQKESGSQWDADNEEEYLKIQQQLSEVFPALIGHIDSTGQAHIKNTDAIDKEIESTNKLIDAQNKVTVNKAIEEFKKLNNELNGSWYESFSNYIFGSLESRIKQQKQIIESMQKNGSDTSAQELELLQFEQQYQQTSEKIKGYIFEVTRAMAEMNGVEINSALINSLQNFVYNLDLTNLDEGKLKTFSYELGKLQEKMQKAIDTNNEKMFNEAVESLNKLASQTTGFDSKLGKFNDTFAKLTGTIKDGSGIINVATDEFSELGDGIDSVGVAIDDAADALDKQVEKLKDLSSAQEQIVGVSEAQIKAVTDSVTVIEFLGNVSERTEQQELSLANSIKLLSALYPQLTNLLKGTSKQREQAIAIIESENKANKALLKGYELSANGKMNAEGKATIVHLEETNKRIKNINAEIRALDTLQANYNNIINAMSKSKSATNDIDLLRQEKLSSQAYDKITLKQAELATLSGTQSTYSDSLLNTVSAIEEYDKSSKSSNKSQKDKNTTTKDSIYITDKYKQALEALNLEIEKQQKLQAKYPEHSNEYRKHLEVQIKLEKEKLALQEKQAKAIQSQIASGKIQQTGNVSSKSSTATASTTNANVNGFNGRISSNYGQRGAEFHRGVDIASPLGSRLDAPVSGKVIKAGDAKANGMSWTYGNLVVVQDDSGVKHIMAHMDKVVAKIGDYVQAGTQIGTVGSTGNSTGPHVHYEQNTANGKLIDPTSYVNQVRSGKVSVSPSSGVSTVDNGQQAIDQAKSDLLGLQKDVLNTKDTIDNLNELLVKSNVAYYNHLIDGVDRSIKKSNILANQQLEHSQAYRDELEKETKHLEYKQSLLHKEANFIREQLKRTDLSPAFKDELTTQLSELSLSWWDVEESIKSVNEQIENSKIAEFDKKIESLNDAISKSNKLMDIHAKGSKEYNNEQKNIVSTLYEKQKAYETEADALRKSIQLEKLSIKEIERKKERLKELSSTWLELQSEIIRINSDIADELISTMKDAYGQQRDYELALKDKQIEDLEELRDAKLNALEEEGKAYEESIKQQMDALDKAHKDKLSKLDEESKAFEDAINRQLELMRKQRDEEDFNKDIGKLQKEEATIVAKINELSMDDSREAKLQRKKLEEELANVREQIADKQNDRQYELREQNLQDELDAYKSQQDAKKETEDNNYNTSKEALDNQLELYKKELEAKKKLEEEKFKASKAQLERERKDIVNHYDQLINNEQEYANLRAQIINGSVDGMNEKLSTFLGNFKNMNKELINELGISWQELENKIYRITQAQGSLGNISTPNQNVDLNNGSIIGSGSNSNNSSSNTSARDNAWQQYLSNKKAWDSASAAEKARLNKENEKLRNQWGFQDGSYASLKNLKKYHSGGIVGGKGNRLTELTNKLFNTKPNEETVLALKRELYVPENNVDNMFTNIRAAMPNFKVNSPQGGSIKIDSLLSIDSVSQNANLDIARLTDQVMDTLIDKMRPYGFNIR